MSFLASVVHVGDTIWRLEKIDKTISISSNFEQKELMVDVFFQAASVIMHAYKELEYINTFYPNSSVILREDTVGEETLSLRFNKLKKIDIFTNKWSITLDQKQFKMMVDDLYNAINTFVTWTGFNAHNYDPAFLNVMLAEQLPYICGEKIVDMYLDELLVPHVPYQPNVPETVSLRECVRVNSLRGEVDIDSFNRRKSNHYGQSNSMRLKSVLQMIVDQGYPFNNEYITIFSTSNLVVDGWHRASCLYYLYGNISVPVKIIVLDK